MNLLISYKSNVISSMSSLGHWGKTGNTEATVGGSSTLGHGVNGILGINGLVNKHHQRSRLDGHTSANERLISDALKPVQSHQCWINDLTCWSLPAPVTHSKRTPEDLRNQAARNTDFSPTALSSSIPFRSPNFDHGWQLKPAVKNPDFG